MKTWTTRAQGRKENRECEEEDKAIGRAEGTAMREGRERMETKLHQLLVFANPPEYRYTYSRVCWFVAICASGRFETLVFERERNEKRSKSSLSLREGNVALRRRVDAAYRSCSCLERQERPF